MGGVAKALLAGKGGRTFLATILATAREVGLDEALVVVGPPYGEAVGAHARELGARVIENTRPARGMASSVALGFAAVTADAAWLWPVDHPGLETSTLRALIAALGAHEAAGPVYRGRGGHPPLVARALFPALAACADRDGGARAVLAGADVVDVAVDDPATVRDIDVARDLEAV
jgi:CTP:molybdopterin cytidylyltransferase MocA